MLQLARHPERPYTLDYIQNMTTDFVELHGDRAYGDDKAIVGGFAKLDGQPVMIIGHQKGRDRNRISIVISGCRILKGIGKLCD